MGLPSYYRSCKSSLWPTENTVDNFSDKWSLSNEVNKTLRLWHVTKLKFYYILSYFAVVTFHSKQWKITFGSRTVKMWPLPLNRGDRSIKVTLIVLTLWGLMFWAFATRSLNKVWLLTAVSFYIKVYWIISYTNKIYWDVQGYIVLPFLRSWKELTTQLQSRLYNKQWNLSYNNHAIDQGLASLLCRQQRRSYHN